MASGGLSTKPAPMPRTMKPPPVGAKPQPGVGHSHSQLGGRSMATLATNAAASVAQMHAHHGGGGQMNEAQTNTGLKEAVDAVVNSFAKAHAWTLENATAEEFSVDRKQIREWRANRDVLLQHETGKEKLKLKLHPGRASLTSDEESPASGSDDEAN